MAVDIIIPPAGDSITSANIGEWHKESGEYVNKGEVIVTLETDKVAHEIEAETSGALEILVEEGEEKDIGAVIGKIDESAEAPAGAAAPASAPASNEEATPAASSEADSDSEEVIVEVSGSKLKVTPLARKVAASKKVNLSEVKGSGPGGRIVKADVENFTPSAVAPAATSAPEAPAAGEKRTTRKKMTMLRRRIAEHLVNAQRTAAILSTFNEVDMTAVMKLRKELQPEFVEKYGVKLGFMSFFVKAVTKALQEVPQINGRIDGNEIIENHFYDIGVAVGTDKGLVVPVVRDCEQKGFADIEKEIIGYANKAKDGSLSLQDMQGGVFTISNGGVYGSLLSTPILSPPQSGILGMHTIQQRPVAVDGKVEIRPMMYLALSYDHRLVDGKEAVTFLLSIKNTLENPTRFLFDL